MEKAELSVSLPDEAATARLGARLAGQLRAGDVVFLSGGLGAGKTALARGCIRAICGAGLDIPSPTFALAQIYDSESITVSHFDLYRLESAEEAEELGIEEAREAGACLIEWPDRLGSGAPAERLEIHLSDAPGAPSARIAKLTGYGLWVERLQHLAP